MKTPLIDIRPDHWAIVRDILQKHVPQYDVWAFGSRAKWTAKEYSDLDLAVITDRPLSLSVSAALADDFSESDLPWKVDIVDWATTSESFRKIIERDKVVVQEAKTGRVMVGAWQPRSIGKAFAVNPPRTIKRGQVTPFIPMDALPENARSPMRIDEREFTGSGVKFQNGDTLIARITPCLENGKTAFVCGLPEGVVAHGSTEYIVLAGKPNESDNLFAYYLARSPDFRQHAIGHMEGTSGRQRVPSVAVENFTIALPPLSEQRAIAHILGTLDDKIELNRRMNETLEAIARAIFKSWFIDFDPVRAKASGESPESICRRLGLTPDLLALFPDRLVDSELGEIPEGWQVQPLEQLSEKISKGTTPTKQDIADATDAPSVPFIKVRDINDRGEVIRDGLELIPESVHRGALKRSILEAGDILFSIAGTVGRIAVVEPDLANSNANQAVAFVRLKDNAAHLGLCLQHLKSDRIQVAASASVVQAVQANVSLASLGAFKIIVPEDGVLELWNQIFGGLFNKTRVCTAESRTLAAVRDTLLPKLLSGELRVSEADSNIEVCA